MKRPRPVLSHRPGPVHLRKPFTALEMNVHTVPRPATTPDPTAELRALLAAIGDVLDVPLDGDRQAAYRLTRERAVVVRAVARACADGITPTDPAQWLRNVVAEHAPVAEGGVE